MDLVETKVIEREISKETHNVLPSRFTIFHTRIGYKLILFQMATIDFLYKYN